MKKSNYDGNYEIKQDMLSILKIFYKVMKQYVQNVIQNPILCFKPLFIT